MKCLVIQKGLRWRKNQATERILWVEEEELLNEGLRGSRSGKEDTEFESPMVLLQTLLGRLGIEDRFGVGEHLRDVIHPQTSQGHWTSCLPVRVPQFSWDPATSNVLSPCGWEGFTPHPCFRGGHDLSLANDRMTVLHPYGHIDWLRNGHVTQPRHPTPGTFAVTIRKEALFCP
jgi:hypothetical protein